MKPVLTAALAFAITLPPAALARLDLTGLEPEKAGDTLVEYAEDYHAGWDSSEARARLLMYDSTGTQTVRNLETYVIEKFLDSEDARSYIVYDNVGTGLLTYMYRDKADIQWVWVPGLRKLRRLRMEGISGAFVGSEFSYEDFRSQYPRKFRNRLLGETELDGQKVWEIERAPLTGDSAYSRLHVFMDQEHFRVLKTDFYDQAGKPLKTLHASDWKREQERWWRAGRSRMVNHQTGRSSEMVTDSIRLDTGLADFRHLLK